jgi:hypothetical protein
MFAGEQAQVDWGHFGTLTVGKACRRLSCFVMVLSYSRLLYARFVFDQSMENFLQNHIDGFSRMGGVPRIIRYDNLKTAVIERFGQAIRFNQTLLEMAGYYRFKPSACNPYSGHEKGRVERNIRYIRDNFHCGRNFESLADANQQLRTWLDDVCNVRPWPDDRQRKVIDVWRDEQERLLPLPGQEYSIEHPRAVASGKFPYIRFDLNDYSIPYQLVRKPLSLVVSEQWIRLLDGTLEVARHQRSYDRGKKVRDDDHFSGLYEQKPGADMNDGRAFLVKAIPDFESLFEMMIMQGLPLGASTKKLVQLIEVHGIQATRDVVKEAIQKNIPRIAFIAMRLGDLEKQRNSPPAVSLILPDRQDIRDISFDHHDLAVYDQLLNHAADEGSTNRKGPNDEKN